MNNVEWGIKITNAHSHRRCMLQRIKNDDDDDEKNEKEEETILEHN